MNTTKDNIVHFTQTGGSNQATVGSNHKGHRSAPWQGAGEGSLLLGRLRHLARRDKVFTEGQAADHFYQVVSGIVRTYTIQKDGRRTIDGFHMPGDVFGLELGPLHRNSANSLGDLSVVAFRYSDIDSVARADASLGKDLRLALIASLARARDHLLLLAHKTAAEKIAGFLVQIAQRASISKAGNLPLQHADIADYLGLSRETVSRVLSELSCDGVVEVKGPIIQH